MDPKKMSGCCPQPVEMENVIEKTPLKMLYEYWDWRFIIIAGKSYTSTGKEKYELEMSHRDFDSTLDSKCDFDTFWEAEEYVFNFFSKLK